MPKKLNNLKLGLRFLSKESSDAVLGGNDSASVGESPDFICEWWYAYGNSRTHPNQHTEDGTEICGCYCSVFDKSSAICYVAERPTPVNVC
jgi:hypothetical protein